MITLNNEEIANATNGKWINKQEEIEILRVSFSASQVEKGDLFFPYDTTRWMENTKENEDAINRALKKGAVAVALPFGTKISTTIPTLQVEHLRDAFREFAIESTNKTEALKILVAGSFGKTGFKKQLHTLISDFKNTFAFLNSANESLPIYRGLTSIPKDCEIAIIEVAAPGYSLAKRRSNYVKPNIAVITNIGPEHLKQHGGSIENVIENKSRVAYGLNDKGIIIIPNQKEYNTKEKMTNYIKKINPTLQILTFGETEDNDAYIIEKEFSNLGWELEVKINEKNIRFKLPFLEEYSVKAVLPILLVCDKLNLDLNEVVKKYDNYKHYASSGNFYKITYNEKTFYLYDQSIRGILNGFKETLRVMEQMIPENNGRKIALFSEFINFEESSVKEINTNEFQTLFKNSGINSLYTIHQFSEHINVLPNKNIWIEHKTKIEDITDIILNDIKNDDILFVRAVWKTEANKLTEKILKNASLVKQYY